MLGAGEGNAVSGRGKAGQAKKQQGKKTRGAGPGRLAAATASAAVGRLPTVDCIRGLAAAAGEHKSDERFWGFFGARNGQKRAARLGQRP